MRLLTSLPLVWRGADADARRGLSPALDAARRSPVALDACWGLMLAAIAIAASIRNEARGLLREMVFKAPSDTDVWLFWVLPETVRVALRCGDAELAENISGLVRGEFPAVQIARRASLHCAPRRAASMRRQRQASPTPPPAGTTSAYPTRRRRRCSGRGAAWWRLAERPRRQRRSPRLATSSPGSGRSRRWRRRTNSCSKSHPPDEDGPSLLACEHQPRDQRRRLLLHRRDGVRVGVERDRDGGVAEALGDYPGVDPGWHPPHHHTLSHAVWRDPTRQHRAPLGKRVPWGDP